MRIELSAFSVQEFHAFCTGIAVPEKVFDAVNGLFACGAVKVHLRCLDRPIMGVSDIELTSYWSKETPT